MTLGPYEQLGVSPEATDEEIAKAYRRLAKIYHPDVNHGDEKSAKKMSDINAAYEQIKSGKANGYAEEPSFGQGQPSGFGFSAFGAFDQVKLYLSLGRFDIALSLLNGIASRSAEWYYYSAIANYSANNTITALKHAEMAAGIEPGNAEYQRLLDQMRSGGRVYQQRSQEYGVPGGALSKLCLGIVLTNLFCMFCGRPF